uniref:Uncharacterized protein n=1 Tax=Anguilla anguilla TaxID=7936 RepID=A0A0E9QJG5_ANGAN
MVNTDSQYFWDSCGQYQQAVTTNHQKCCFTVL